VAATFYCEAITQRDERGGADEVRRRRLWHDCYRAAADS